MVICPHQPTPDRLTARAVKAAAGFTLVELFIAASVSIFILTGVFALVVLSAAEQRRSFADASVEQTLGNLQDRVSIVLRQMSATESVILADPVYNSASQLVGYRRAIMARGKTPTYPREELTLDPSRGRVVYDPNRAVTGNEVLLHTNTASAVLREGWIAPTTKPDGAPDYSLLSVWLVMDDNRSAGRRTPEGVATNSVSQRSFAVKMRNS